MTSAGFKILSCPNCTKLYKKIIIASYNTFDTDIYSDGHMEGGFIPTFLSIVKCINNDCNAFFNVKDAKVIAELNNKYFDAPKWKDVFYLSGYKIGVKELEEALETNFCNNTENEKQVRILLLRRYNDSCRHNPKYKFSTGDKDAFINNVARLIELAKSFSSIDDQLFLAELYREKGDFDACLKVLDEFKHIDKGKVNIKEKIYSQAKIKSEKVFKTSKTAIKKEYKCNSCNDSLILFDLDKNQDHYKYKYYRCTLTNEVFSSSSKLKIPNEIYYMTGMAAKLKQIGINDSMIDNTQVLCPCCGTIAVEEFLPETQKCVKCNEGNYTVVNWFN